MKDATPGRIPLGRFISFGVFVVYWFYVYANLGHEIAHPYYQLHPLGVSHLFAGNGSARANRLRKEASLGDITRR